MLRSFEKLLGDLDAWVSAKSRFSKSGLDGIGRCQRLYVRKGKLCDAGKIRYLQDGWISCAGWWVFWLPDHATKKEHTFVEEVTRVTWAKQLEEKTGIPQHIRPSFSIWHSEWHCSNARGLFVRRFTAAQASIRNACWFLLTLQTFLPMYRSANSTWPQKQTPNRRGWEFVCIESQCRRFSAEVQRHLIFCTSLRIIMPNHDLVNPD